MKTIKIEWKHYDKEGQTCTRCNSTGENILEALKQASANPKYEGIKFFFIETKLKASEMSDSNLVLINEKPIEKLIEATSQENHCESCSCLTGEDTNCRTVKISNIVYEEIPTNLILEAIYKSVCES